MTVCLVFKVLERKNKKTWTVAMISFEKKDTN